MHLTEKRRTQLEDIETNIKSLVESFGQIFDGHSNIQDLSNEQVLFFNIRSLTEMKGNIYAVQMLNIFSLLWGGMMNNGAPQKRKWNKGQLAWEDVCKYLIVIDEAHRIINPNMEFAIEYVLNFANEARKYFAGLFFATPSIRQFVPENASGTYVDKVKNLFDQTTYKFIMLQDSNTIPQLKQIFGGQITDSEFEQIPNYNQAEALICIKGSGKYHVEIDANEEEISIFGGGA